MGSQQLLLIVVGLIVVAIAIIVGMTLLGSGSRSANKDAIAEDLLRMGAIAQGYFQKPQTIGGGGESFEGMEIHDLGATQIDASYDGAPAYSENENARYVIRSTTATTCVLEGLSQTETGTDGKPATIRATVTKGDISLTFVNWD